ncbi:MAG: exodeoxyribonuclease VII small subunit [Bacteroidales bacterium]
MAKAPNLSYDQALSEIETTLERIEKGDLGVDDLAQSVEHLTRLLDHCRDRLHRTEARVNQILDPEEGSRGTGS